MIERIKLLMSVKNVTPAQLANSIGVQRSGISHILSGRNKPSLDFVLKIFDSFPDLNETWLLQGKGEMLKATKVKEPDPEIYMKSIPSTPGLNLEKGIEEAEHFENKGINSPDEKTKEEGIEEMEHGNVEKYKPKSLEMREEVLVSDSKFKRKIIKWIAIYDDDSFKEFHGQ